MEKLTRKMEERLERWRSTLVAKEQVKKSPGSQPAKQTEYGDTMREYERREAEMFQQQLHKYGVRR